MENKYLKLKFLGVDLQSPITVGSGTFGYGECFQEYFALSQLGFLTSKGITLEPRVGNHSPRVAEVAQGMINSVGLENPGLEAFIKNKLPIITQYNLPHAVNINGRTIEEYVALASQVDQLPGVNFVELNISCPNVKEGGMAFGTNLETTRNIVRAVRQVLVNKKLIVKLSPSVSDIRSFARICEQYGADAIALINTIPAMKIDIKSRRPVLGNGIGGLSGPCIKPIAIRMVYEAYQAVRIPIIGMGGISSWQDALEFIMAGASVIGIGTGMLVNPNLPNEIITGLTRYCSQHKIANLQELVGCAQPYGKVNDYESN